MTMEVTPPPPYLALPIIAEHLLTDDVVDYLNFRAVCREWRSCTASPRGLDSCFRPRRWIMLPDGDANLHTGTHRRFLNLSTGRSLLLHLPFPELDTHYLISDSDGLLVLVDKVTHLVRLFNPFTRHLADLPRLPSGTVDDGIPSMIALYSCTISTGSCPTVVIFSPRCEDAYFAKPGDSSWVAFEFQRAPDSMLFFKDRFYLADPVDGVQYVQVELDRMSCTTLIPRSSDSGPFDQYYLAECNSELLLVYRKVCHDGNHLELEGHIFKVFRVDLEFNRLVSFSNARDICVILGYWSRCLVLSSKCLPSIKGNSIYCCTGIIRNPLIVYYFDNGEPESISAHTALHDYLERISPSIRPFTLAHHLATYCNQLNWSIGLMYHEFTDFPEGWLDCHMDDLIRNYSLF